MAQHVYGRRSVTAALVGNIAVGIAKGAVFFITGSPSMYAEAVHSLADTLNQTLLLVGLKRSHKPADSKRGYGYGIERFFWSLISACGILFIGAGVAIFHSLDTLVHKESGAAFSMLGIFVLIFAFAVEGATLWSALHELRKGRALSREMFVDADPILLAIIYEDSVAVVGVLIALLAQGATYLTGDIFYDALGGIIVGAVLGALAILLIIKNHQYIVGKALSKEVTEELIEILEKDPCVEKVIEFKSVAVGIGKYRIFATVEWNGTPLYEEIYEAGDLQEEFDKIKNDFNEFAKLMLRTTDRVPRLVGTHIDRIEKNIVRKFPQIAYVDIEIN
jgi:solute carrier family 30 (zinc transporter), member 9